MKREIVDRLPVETSAASDTPTGTGARLQPRNSTAASFASMKRWTQPLGIAAVALMSVLVTGCTTIGAERVAGWPQLEVFEHYVPHKEMRDRCGRYVSAGSSPEACAEFDFAAGRCDLWFSSDFPPARYVIEHERQHCLGYEHVGEHDLGNILSRYLAALPSDSPVSASQGPSLLSAKPASAAGI